MTGFALLGLLVAQWMLSSAIHGTNYDGGDGKMAETSCVLGWPISFAIGNNNERSAVGPPVGPLSQPWI
jgi:hypothetical protein